MVRIRLDFGASGWREKALRCLEAGVVLEQVPEEHLEELVSRAEARDVDHRVEEASGGYRIVPAPSDR